MKQEDTYYIIGIDGGASKTRGILFTQAGETIATAFEKVGKELRQRMSWLKN